VQNIKDYGWLVERLASPFSTKIGYISNDQKWKKDKGGPYKLLC